MDTTLTLPKGQRPSVDDPNATRLLPNPVPNSKAIPFFADDISQLRNPTGWLNDNSVNACAQLLSGYFGTENVTGGRPAILSSFAMAQQRDGTSLDDGMWRVNHRSRYWEKDVWIIPIHQPSTQHWELAIVYLRQCRIAYFDSLAHPKTWEEDVQVRVMHITMTFLHS